MENQEIIFKLSMSEQRLQQLQQQLQAVESKILELESLYLDLDEIPKSVNREVLAQVGMGIYAKARIISEDLIVNVGENKFIGRNVSRTKEMIEGQIKRLRDIEEELNSEIEAVSRDFSEMIEEYKKMEKD